MEMSDTATNCTIVRPPLSATYELPSRDRLLEVQPGDLIKLCFRVGERSGEVMWVKVIECCYPREWRGTLQNEPHNIKEMRYEDDITFHPLDVIDVRRFEDNKSTDDDGASNMRTFHEFCNVVTEKKA
jgi:hypothetical protein